MALPLGVQGNVAGNGRLKVVRGRAVLIGVPAHKVIGDGRRVFRNLDSISPGNLDRVLLRERHVRVERNGELLLLELGPDLSGADLGVEVELLRAVAVGVPTLKVIALTHRICGLFHRGSAIGVPNAQDNVVKIAAIDRAHEQDGRILLAAAKHREQRHVLGNRHVGVPNGRLLALQIDLRPVEERLLLPARVLRGVGRSEVAKGNRLPIRNRDGLLQRAI